MYHGKVVTYASRKLKDHKRNYPARDIEFLIMIVALNIWCYYLYGVYVDIYSYNKILQYMFTQMELNHMQRRWLALLKDYDMILHNHLGKANMVDDAFSKLSMGSLSYLEDKKR